MIHLWMAPLLLAVPATVNPAQAFGRLEQQHLRIAASSSVGVLWPASGCRSARTDSAVACGLRFIGDDQETGGSYQLSFVSDWMEIKAITCSCDNSGCGVDSRRWSATLLSTSSASQMPEAWPAKGLQDQPRRGGMPRAVEQWPDPPR